MKKFELLTLKAKIKGLAAEGVRARKFINSSSGDAKYANWNIKRDIGQEARLHLVAYSLLLDKEYVEIESNVSTGGLTKLFYKIDYLFEIINRHADSEMRAKYKDINILKDALYAVERIITSKKAVA